MKLYNFSGELESIPRPQHTPGPWIFDTFNAHECVIEGSNGQVVHIEDFVVHIEDFGSLPDEAIGKDEIIDEMRANCRLIAAAPELLQALRGMVASYEYEASMENAALLEAKRVIARAEGSSAK